MQREILIVRHGKLAKSAQGQDPQHAPLSGKGKRRAQRLGVWLAQNALLPQNSYCAISVAARVTTEKLLKASTSSVLRFEAEPVLSQRDPHRVLHWLQRLPEHWCRVLLVVDDPLADRVTRMLADSVALFCEGEGSLYKPASVALLTFNGPWTELQPGDAVLADLVSAKGLPELFPFPDLSGCEWRERPAYYYSQSAVLPYRIRHQKLELLLISSGGLKHWVVPKGVHEPGMSAAQSAEKEAYEEGGVLGCVDDTPLGDYRYSKWGADCRVEVYPMRVDDLLTGKAWQESHRLRRWVSIVQARALLQEQALLPMIDELAVRVLK